MTKKCFVPEITLEDPGTEESVKLMALIGVPFKMAATSSRDLPMAHLVFLGMLVWDSLMCYENRVPLPHDAASDAFLPSDSTASHESWLR